MRLVADVRVHRLETFSKETERLRKLGLPLRLKSSAYEVFAWFDIRFLSPFRLEMLCQSNTPGTLRLDRLTAGQLDVNDKMAVSRKVVLEGSFENGMGGNSWFARQMENRQGDRTQAKGRELRPHVALDW